MEIEIVCLDGETIGMIVQPDEVVGNVLRRVCNRDGLLANPYQELHMNDVKMIEFTTMADNAIESGAILKCVLRRHKIFVSIMGDKTFMLRVYEKTTTLDLKQLIFEQIGLHPCHQVLSFRGSLLFDRLMLWQQGIEHHDTVLLCGRLRGGAKEVGDEQTASELELQNVINAFMATQMKGYMDVEVTEERLEVLGDIFECAFYEGKHQIIGKSWKCPLCRHRVANI